MFFVLSMFFLLVFMMLIFFFNYYYYNQFDTKTFFECGFETLQSFRSLFSLRFFSISIIFLIFDMEMVFVLPLVLFYSFVKFFFFFIYSVLLMGIFLEWNQGGLQWK